jgi:2-succinyl-6-hydroxy-2,4-cyclohexadiene-1-carboxylate synthase
LNSGQYNGRQFTDWHWGGTEPNIYGLHGFMGTGQDFSLLANHLDNAFTAVDLIGHGLSESPTEEAPYRLMAQLGFLQHYLPKHSILMGYSMGARLALQFACRSNNPPKALILVSGTAGLHSEREIEERLRWDQEMSSSIVRDGVPQFVERWQETPIIQSQKNIKKSHYEVMRSNRLRQSPIGLSNSMRFFGAGSMPHCWDLLASLSIPVLLIVGGQDEKYIDLSLSMLDLIPNASLAVIPNVGHCAHLEDPVACHQAITRWFIEEK